MQPFLLSKELLIFKQKYKIHLNNIRRNKFINTKELIQEKEHLEDVLKLIEDKKSSVDQNIDALSQTISAMKTYLTEDYYTFDREEALQTNYQLKEATETLIFAEVEKQRFLWQKKSPYFARLDCELAESTTKPLYIGLAHLEGKDEPLIYDWRAPISSMFYEYGVGKAQYSVDKKIYQADIADKFQYRIADGELKYLLKTNMTISDEVLQYALSKDDGLKMKEIASTIQKEQNKIIREESYKNLIVDGVAGSGKTSVALHRASYLLYNNRNRLTSDDILILSPSNAFSSFISGVLPALGESDIQRMTFLNFAEKELKLKFEDRETFIERLLEEGNREVLRQMQFKSDFTFLNNLETYVKTTLANSFMAKDINFGAFSLSKAQINDLYFNRFSKLAIFKRIEFIAEYILDHLNIKANEREFILDRIIKILRGMFPSINPVEIYKYFMDALNLKFDSLDISHSDIAGILYIKSALLGLSQYFNVKQLIIDEMQDYTPVHFAIIKSIFNCPKIILGDRYQCIEKTLNDKYFKRLSTFLNAEFLSLKKSYRSTSQISEVTQKVLACEGFENFSREGHKVNFVNMKTKLLPVSIKNACDAYAKYGSVGIICKTQKEAQEVYAQLKEGLPLHLIEKGEPLCDGKYFVMSAAASKGLEFEAVVVPYASLENFKSRVDRQILYIILTRAIHELCLINNGKKIKFLE